MLRGMLLGLLILALMSACTAAPSPSPSPSPTSNITPSLRPTQTISPDELTFAANYRATHANRLPATFTPTFTATFTLTPTITLTPSFTPFPTIIPEEALCPNFLAGTPLITGEIPLDAPEFLQVYIPTDKVYVLVEFYDAEANELIRSQLYVGGEDLFFQFSGETVDHTGEYKWRVSLQDETRTEMCVKEKTFTLTVPNAETTESPESTAEATAEVTEAPEYIVPNATATPR